MRSGKMIEAAGPPPPPPLRKAMEHPTEASATPRELEVTREFRGSGLKVNQPMTGRMASLPC